MTDLHLKPFFATPVHDGRVALEFLEGMEDLVAALTAAGIPFIRGRVKGDSHIERARNHLHAIFLASDATHIFWIDGDLGFPPQAVLDSLHFLLSTGEGMVGGPYVRKIDDGEWPWTFEPLKEPKPSILLDHKRFVPVRAVATGFLAMSRACCEKLGEGRRRYRGGTRRDPLECVDLFKSQVGETFLGEDFPLCYRWGEQGGTVWLNADAQLVHVGTKTYGGKLAMQNAQDRLDAPKARE